MILKEFVENKLTVFIEKVDTWEDAIRLGCEPLLRDGTITEEYVLSIIESIKQHGPYIVITPMVAIPHSTQEAGGVNGTKISFMKVDNVVKFDENDSTYDAKLFFTLAAKDPTEHMENLQKLMELLMKDNVIDELLAAKSDEDLLDIDTRYFEDIA